MKRRRVLLKYDDAPPSVSGIEVSVYLADEVDEVLKRQAAAAISGMNAAKAISSHQAEAARRLKAESAPDALESERAANARLTQENERLRKALSQRLQQLEEARRCLEGVASCSTCEVCRGAAQSHLHPTGNPHEKS